MRWGEEPWDGKQQQNSGIISSRPGLTLGEINKFPLLEPLSNSYILILDSCSYFFLKQTSAQCRVQFP
jgi:hypothetical protein